MIDRPIVTHCALCLGDLYEDGAHTTRGGAHACAHASNAARIIAQRAALAAAERRLIESAVAAELARRTEDAVKSKESASYEERCAAENRRRDLGREAAKAVGDLIKLRDAEPTGSES